jgi:very-short-patch-repair endonuclease
MLNELGVTVLRFWNEEVIKDSAKVIDEISKYLR